MSDRTVMYVCGFLRVGESWLLVKKSHGPRYVIGRWNGIGGEVEGEEDPKDAMRREFREEVGDFWTTDWRRFCVLHGPDYVVFFYAAFRPPLNGEEAIRFPAVNDVGEQLGFMGEDDDWGKALVPNLPWLLAMATCDDPNIPYSVIQS